MLPGDVGDEIPMRYNPRNPNEAMIARALLMWYLAGTFSVVGLVIGGIGLLVLLT